MIELIMMVLLNQGQAADVVKCNPNVSKPCGNVCIQKEFKCSKAPGKAVWGEAKDASNSKPMSDAEYQKAYGNPKL